jgi:hypothetical protein
MNRRLDGPRSLARRVRTMLIACASAALLAAPPAVQAQALGELVGSLLGGLLGGGGTPPSPAPGGPLRDLVGNLLAPIGGIGGIGGGPTGERPRVVSAISTSNVTVLVDFSTAMGDSAIDPSHYSIVQENENPEVGFLGVTAAEFVDSSRLGVRLTTRSQNEVTYRVRVSNVRSRGGQPLADQEPFGVDPTSATFAGTPPSDGGIDTDGDGLTDDEEQLGWPVVIRLASGEIVRRQVTSSPDHADTDGDGLDDFTEKGLSIDPRDPDTDDDGITDFSEYNEIFSSPSEQDSDGDGLTDGLEVDFYRSSAILADTDGDQIPDGEEVNFANRNPSVADLPKPSLEIGEMNMELDVRFLEVSSTGAETKEIDSKTVSTKLTQSSSKEHSRGESRTSEASVKLGTKVGFEVKAAAEPEATVSTEFTTETSSSFSMTSNWTSTSRRETENEYEKSLSTSEEATISEGSSVTREVQGARLQVAVTLRNEGDIAFTLRNLQVVALIQNPQDPSRLTPIATLLPDSEPANGVNLGPLVPERGPFIFSNDQVFPQLVEELMRNPRGLVFQFANYDLTDELGRNFAFTSQEITDRTAALTIDFGGVDENRDGLPDAGAEIVRVATGIGQRIDTNGDGVVDDDDRVVVFDGDGNQIGIGLREALEAYGLTELDESERPSDSLTDAEADSSYSVLRGADGFERIFRIRRTLARTGESKMWAIITETGIDGDKPLDDYVLRTGSSLSLAFLQDLDGDGLPASVEAMNNCSDQSADTDGDGLDDRFETLVGWTVDLGVGGQRRVFSRCSSTDSDGDGIGDREEAPALVELDERGLVRFDFGHEPRRDDQGLPAPGPGDTPAERVAKRLAIHLADPITDPSRADTDGDGIDDATELDGYDVCGRGASCPPAGTDPPLYVGVKTSPELFDTDEDTASDGLESRLGGNPADAGDFALFGDSDGDGLVNVQETDGWMVTVRQVSVLGSPGTNVGGRNVCDGECADNPTPAYRVFSDPNDRDSDDDGLSDYEEYLVGSDPGNRDTDGDGLTDFEEVRGFSVHTFGIVSTDPTDADTDDDKVSDFLEAGRGPRYVVRIPGESPYEAFSHPLDPDTDLDRLVDGDERFYGSDPSKPNTDGDHVLDYEEILRGSRAAVPDVLVEAFVNGLFTEQDCDDTTAGDFLWDLGVLKPNETTLTVLSSTDPSSPGYDADVLTPLPTCTDEDQALCIQRPGTRVQFGDGFRLTLTGSTRFGLSTSQSQFEEFSFAGEIGEYDGAGANDFSNGFPRFYPDDGADPSGRVPGNAVELGFHRLEIPTEIGGNCKFNLIVSYTAR